MALRDPSHQGYCISAALLELTSMPRYATLFHVAGPSWRSAYEQVSAHVSENERPAFGRHKSSLPRSVTMHLHRSTRRLQQDRIHQESIRVIL